MQKMSESVESGTPNNTPCIDLDNSLIDKYHDIKTIYEITECHKE